MHGKKEGDATGLSTVPKTGSLTEKAEIWRLSVARTGEPRTKNNATAFVVERGKPAFAEEKRK